MATYGPTPPGGFDHPWGGAVLGKIFRNPPDDDLITVDDEVILYKRRQHPLALVPEFVRSAALMFALIQVTLGVGTMGPLSGFLFLVSLVVLARWAHRMKRWKPIAWLLALALVWNFTGWGRFGVYTIVSLQALGQVLLAIIRHQSYEFLYVTNRQLIATNGILTKKVSSMPIAKITDSQLTMTFFGELMERVPWSEKYGMFTVESAGQNQALGKLPFLVDPHFFKQTVQLAPEKAVPEDD